jgi:hypothetical protein
MTAPSNRRHLRVRTGGRARRSRARLSGALVLPVLALLVLVVLPFASATYRVEVTPPFEGLTPVVATTINTDGCHSVGKFVHPAVVNTTSGKTMVAEKSVSRPCSVAFAYAVTFATVGFEGPNFTVPVSRAYSVTFDWRLSFNVSLRVVGSDNENTAIASVFAVGVLFDGTNQTFLPVNATFPLFVAIHSGSYAREARAVAFTLASRLKLVTGHLYDFETFLECDATAELRAAGSAVAYLDLATEGNHGVLRSMALAG